jgi:putative radical SAM enzyme (TIGR03279 family)
VNGLTINAVEAGSALARLGVRAGDRLLAIDDLVPRDVIDVQLELGEARRLTLERAERQRVTLTPEGPLDAAALTLDDPVPGGIRECNNHCEFCFIRGLPKGLRPTLYVFDDDYRYSFLWGNFLTLTNLEEADWTRIGYERLSPLNVSVHATDDDVRRELLNNRHAPAILPQLRRLARLGIEVNAQVVLCAGQNDGAVLERTIDDLAQLYPSVRSLSVVPVGLTRYSRVKHIRRPTSDEARRAVEQIERHQSALRSRHGIGFVYASDELYVLAGRDEVPSAENYDGFPVLSNGVGLLRNMLDEWRALLERGRAPSGRTGPSARPARSAPPAASARRHASAERQRSAAAAPPAPPQRKIVWLTGRLAAPALERMADDWCARTGWRPRVEVVENTFFGNEVTVSGLLSGADLMRALQALPTDVDAVVLPRGPFGFDGRCTLDGISADEVGASHPGRVYLASTPAELLEILADV